MRTSILVWSTLSGALLGVLLDAALVGLAVMIAAVLPALSTRFQQRWLAASSVVVLALIPTALAVLGFLEGRLKTR